jgi:hypothetical protein
MHMSSSAANAVTIPTWTTATSPLNFSRSAGRTPSRTASRHTGTTPGVSTGGSRFPRQPRRAGQNDPRTLRRIFRDRPQLAVSCEGRSLLPADRGGFGPVHGRAVVRAARPAPICLCICLPSHRGPGPDRLEYARNTCRSRPCPDGYAGGLELRSRRLRDRLPGPGGGGRDPCDERLPSRLAGGNRRRAAASRASGVDRAADGDPGGVRLPPWRAAPAAGPERVCRSL